LSENNIPEQQLQDRLFLLDTSRSMGWHIRGGKERKLDLMKEGVMAFCTRLWPLSYYDKPIRLGIVAFRLLGVPGDTRFEVVVPLYPSPMSLELFRLQKIDAKGGCYVSDGLKYASIVLRESERQVRRLDLITDGDSQGPDPVPYARIFKDAGIFLNLIELSENPTPQMQEIASQGGGKYWNVRNAYELAQALE
jgi:Mg-chelatase subunit ChlD